MKAQFGEGKEVNIYDIDDEDDGLPPMADPFNPNNRSRWQERTGKNIGDGVKCSHRRNIGDRVKCSIVHA